MTDITFDYIWTPHDGLQIRHDRPGRWSITAPDTTDADQLFNFLETDLDYEVGAVERCIEAVQDAVAGRIETSDIIAGNDGAIYYGGGHVLVASDHDDHARVVLTADELLRFLTNVHHTMRHPDYRNPDHNPFERFTLQVIATGDDSVHEYWRRGGITPAMPPDYRPGR